MRMIVSPLAVAMGSIRSVAVPVFGGRFLATRDGSRRGQHEPPGLDPLGPDQRVGEFSDLPGRPAKEDHLQASPLVQMDVGRGHHLFQVLVLEVRETLGDPPGVVIVDERDNPHASRRCPPGRSPPRSAAHASGPGPPRSDSVAMLLQY